MSQLGDISSKLYIIHALNNYFEIQTFFMKIYFTIMKKESKDL